MQKDIDLLNKLAAVNCGSRDDENHDCDNCVYCEARNDLNEIGEITASAVSSAKRALVHEKCDHLTSILVSEENGVEKNLCTWACGEYYYTRKIDGITIEAEA